MLENNEISESNDMTKEKSYNYSAKKISIHLSEQFLNSPSQNQSKNNNVMFVSPESKMKMSDNKNNKISIYSPYVINTSSSKLVPFSTSQKVDRKISKNSYEKFKFYSPNSAKDINKSERLSDRFIPMNKGINLIEKFNLARRVEVDENKNPFIPEKNDKEIEETNGVYGRILKDNVFRDGEEGFNNKNFLPHSTSLQEKVSHQMKSKIFKYKTNEKSKKNLFQEISEAQKENTNNNYTYENVRKINPKPYKILPAENLLDDFYLNLVDWSSKNQIAVGCGNSVILWSVNKTQSEILLNYENDNRLDNMDLNNGNNEKYVSSLIWSQNGEQLVVGNSHGIVELWDVNKHILISSYPGHSNRVGAVSMFENVLSSGSKDCVILSRDVRIRSGSSVIVEHRGHEQEVCGLKWSFDGTQLASGGNDNNLILWTLHSPKPLMVSGNHSAAVKAIAWSPHRHNLLASGGGTADRTIRFWNTSTLTQTSKIDSGSQVCNLVFSKTSNELVSTHGFSLNQINLWKLPSMTKIATLIGHTFRVLYLGLSPNGQNIVTGAGDQSLRFWNLFPPYQTDVSSCLFPSNQDLR